MHSLQEAGAVFLVKVVQEIRHQHDIVTAAEIHAEGISDDLAETIRNACGAGVFLRDGQHRFPVQRDEVRARIFQRHRDAVGPVAGGDVEHAGVPGGIQRQQRRSTLGGGHHHGAHGPGKLHPRGMVRRGGAVLRGVQASQTDGGGQV